MQHTTYSRGFLLLVIVPLLATATRAQERHFKYLGEGERAGMVLFENRRAMVQVVEVWTMNHEVHLDTLDIWVQHIGSPADKIDPRAMRADLILACYPQWHPIWAQEKAIMPSGEGKLTVWEDQNDVWFAVFPEEAPPTWYTFHQQRRQAEKDVPTP